MFLAVRESIGAATGRVQVESGTFPSLSRSGRGSYMLGAKHGEPADGSDVQAGEKPPEEISGRARLHIGGSPPSL